MPSECTLKLPIIIKNKSSFKENQFSSKGMIIFQILVSEKTKITCDIHNIYGQKIKYS